MTLIPESASKEGDIQDCLTKGLFAASERKEEVAFEEMQPHLYFSDPHKP